MTFLIKSSGCFISSAIFFVSLMEPVLSVVHVVFCWKEKVLEMKKILKLLNKQW